MMESNRPGESKVVNVIDDDIDSKLSIVCYTSNLPYVIWLQRSDLLSNLFKKKTPDWFKTTVIFNGSKRRVRVVNRSNKNTDLQNYRLNILLL